MESSFGSVASGLLAVTIACSTPAARGSEACSLLPEFEALESLRAGKNPYGIAGADLDRDSDPDLAVANLNSQEVTILLNDGSARFTAGPGLPVPGQAAAIASGDLDRDGWPDLLVVTGIDPGMLFIFRNHGDGS